MTHEELKTQLAQVEELELRSFDQLADGLDLIGRLLKSETLPTPTDCLKLTEAALRLKAEFSARIEALQKALKAADWHKHRADARDTGGPASN